MQVKTITTAAGVNEIDFGNDSSQSTAHFYWLKNLGDSTLYVSANPNPIAEKDDVAELPAKGAVSVETDEGKVYILGAGKVEIHRTNSKFCPFDWQSSGSGGGGGGSITVDSELSDTSTNPLQNKVTTAAIKEVNSTVETLEAAMTQTQEDVSANTAALKTKSDINHIHDISASGNPVVIDNLQGGVPFSEITVSGKNLTPDTNRSGTTLKGVTFTLNGDGSITANGTATGTVHFAIHNPEVGVNIDPNKSYTISGCPNGGSNSTYCFYGAFTDNIDYGNGCVFSGENIFYPRIAVYKGYTANNLVFHPQLELGDTPTEYEPYITGRELTVNVSGENLLKYPYVNTTKTINGITFTDNGDGTITANGTAVSDLVYDLSNFTYKKGIDYILSGCPNGGGNSTYKLKGLKTGIKDDIGNAKLIRVEEDVTSTLCIMVYNGCTVENLVFRPQLELGSTVTPYEPYHGSTTTITPTSNPYVIPNDIRQQDGYNVISVSEGEISVTGAQKNAALKKIWDDMGMDLLFDGLALVASPAEIDLGNYSKYLINCYNTTDAVNKDYCISIVVEYNRLKNIVDTAGAFVHSLYTSYALELHFSGTMSNANYYAKQANTEAASYYTRIYGIK